LSGEAARRLRCGLDGLHERDDVGEGNLGLDHVGRREEQASGLAEGALLRMYHATSKIVQSVTARAAMPRAWTAVTRERKCCQS